jgi:hypothetical protein
MCAFTDVCACVHLFNEPTILFTPPCDVELPDGSP